MNTIEGESGQKYLNVTYIEKEGDIYRPVDMLITSDKDWQMYISRVTPHVNRILGDESFPTICRLLEYERDNYISRETVVTVFSEVLGL